MAMLLTAATALEMQAYAVAKGTRFNALQLITGIGPTETALSLTTMLHHHAGAIDLVINFGIAGSYTYGTAKILDICLAEKELLGDLGVCLPERIERFVERGLSVHDSFLLDQQLRQHAEQGLCQAEIPYRTGTFITVNCASGTQERADLLGRQFQALCENMEGAAIARVCHHFKLPCLELRCISNMAGEANKEKWQLREACTLAGQAAATVVEFFLKDA